MSRVLLGTLRRYGVPRSEEEPLSLALAHALDELYAPEQQRVARSLAQLYRIGGDPAAASYYQRLADFATSREAAHWQASIIINSAKEDWDNWEYIRATNSLVVAGHAMDRVYPLRDTLAVYEAAYDMACRAGVRQDQADALRDQGRLWHELGDLTQSAAHLGQALILSREIEDRHGEAAALHELSGVDVDRGDYEVARARLQDSIQIKEQIGDRAKGAPSWHGLAVLDLRQGDYAGARRKFERALRLSQEAGDRNVEAHSWRGLGAIDERQGKWEAARTNYERALSIRREITDRHGEADMWDDLGLLDLGQGEDIAAMAKFRRAVELKQEIGDAAGARAILDALGKVEGLIRRKRSH